MVDSMSVLFAFGIEIVSRDSYLRVEESAATRETSTLTLEKGESSEWQRPPLHGDSSKPEEYTAPYYPECKNVFFIFAMKWKKKYTKVFFIFRSGLDRLSPLPSCSSSSHRLTPAFFESQFMSVSQVRRRRVGGASTYVLAVVAEVGNML